MDPALPLKARMSDDEVMGQLTTVAFVRPWNRGSVPESAPDAPHPSTGGPGDYRYRYQSTS
jgi:hypothetical protein